MKMRVKNGTKVVPDFCAAKDPKRLIESSFSNSHGVKYVYQGESKERIDRYWAQMFNRNRFENVNLLIKMGLLPSSDFLKYLDTKTFDDSYGFSVDLNCIDRFFFINQPLIRGYKSKGNDFMSKLLKNDVFGLDYFMLVSSKLEKVSRRVLISSYHLFSKIDELGCDLESSKELMAFTMEELKKQNVSELVEIYLPLISSLEWVECCGPENVPDNFKFFLDFIEQSKMLSNHDRLAKFEKMVSGLIDLNVSAMPEDSQDKFLSCVGRMGIAGINSLKFIKKIEGELNVKVGFSCKSEREQPTKFYTFKSFMKEVVKEIDEGKLVESECVDIIGRYLFKLAKDAKVDCGIVDVIHEEVVLSSEVRRFLDRVVSDHIDGYLKSNWSEGSVAQSKKKMGNRF